MQVNSGFFSTEVGLFRALKDFLVQFGLPGDPAVLKKYHQMGNLVDDKPWLPLGPTGREINGTLLPVVLFAYILISILDATFPPKYPAQAYFLHCLNEILNHSLLH